MPTLDEVLEQAKAGAQSLVPQTGTNIAPQSGGAVSTYNMNEDAFLNGGGMEVDSFVAVKDTGIKLSKDWTGTLDEFEATIDLRDVTFFMGSRREVGKNVDYARTYDGVTEARSGEPFANVVAEFKATTAPGKNANPYRGADIPMTLTQAIADPRDKAKSFDEGTVVGLTTSITGFKPWSTFHKKVKQAGLGTSVIKVKVKHSPRKNSSGQEYGVCEFELLEIVEDNRPVSADGA